MRTIYVDMDGVLTDFDKRYQEVFGITTYEARTSKEKGLYTRLWNEFIDKGHFGTLDYFPGAQELIEYLDKLKVNKCILTSSGGMDRHSDVQAQKLKWLCDKGISWPAVVVPGRRFKAGFADSRSALIDDTLDNITSFDYNGGFGIRYKDISVSSTIDLLEKWFDK